MCFTNLASCPVGSPQVFTPFKSLLPMVDPDQLVIGGWDISGLNMAEAMERAKVLDFELQKQLVPYMKEMVPLPGGQTGGQLLAFATTGPSTSWYLPCRQLQWYQGPRYSMFQSKCGCVCVCSQVSMTQHL